MLLWRRTTCQRFFLLHCCCTTVCFINLLLFVFNLIPIPPLDGSHVLRQFLPYRVEQVYNRIGMWGLIIIFLFGGGLIFGTFFYPLLECLQRPAGVAIDGPHPVALD